VWRRAFEVAAGPPPDDHACLIHRDDHPANTLWADGRLVGVVDWTGGSWGPPSVDLGHMRVNLARTVGLEVADRFLAAHRALTGFDHHPYWDVVSAVDCAPRCRQAGAAWRTWSRPPWPASAARPSFVMRVGRSGCGVDLLSPQRTAFFTSAAILASSAAVNSVSAKAVGHMAPSSRFATSLKPKVAYRDLNLSALWKKQTTLPSLA
jgi:Phosphotransferase enzyme family